MQNNSCEWSYCFPSGWCHLERTALPAKDSLCSMGNDSAQRSWWLFLQFSPEQPAALSSHVASPFCLSSVRAQGKWLQLKFYVGPLRCSLSLQLSLPGRQKPPLLFTAGCYLCSFSSFMLRSPTWGLDPTLLRGNPLATKLSLWNFSCHLWEPSQPFVPPPHSLSVLLRWIGFFSLSLIIRLLSS